MTTILPGINDAVIPSCAQIVAKLEKEMRKRSIPGSEQHGEWLVAIAIVREAFGAKP